MKKRRNFRIKNCSCGYKKYLCKCNSFITNYSCRSFNETQKYLHHQLLLMNKKYLEIFIEKSFLMKLAFPYGTVNIYEIQTRRNVSFLFIYFFIYNL